MAFIVCTTNAFTGQPKALIKGIEMTDMNDLLDINNFSNPGEFRDAAGLKGIGVSTTFCHAVSSTMAKYGLSFADSCRLLEWAGHLMWAGNCPVISLAGSDFWTATPRDQKVTNTPQTNVKKKNNEHKIRANPRSIFTREQEMRCVFFTLVIRNEALQKKYKGGLKSFVRQYHSQYNKDITTLCEMSDSYLDGAVTDIKANGLVRHEDYVCEIFEPDLYKIDDAVPVAVSWLETRQAKGAVLVSYSPKVVGVDRQLKWDTNRAT